jgi:hypothetical protein
MKEQFEYIVSNRGSIPVDISEKVIGIHRKYVGKKLRLEITNERKRSNAQNRWFHEINNMITEFLRNERKQQGDEDYYKIDEETTKLWIKQNFLGYELDENGEKKLRRTSKLKTFEMAELCENLQRFFAPRGLDIPSPNEYTNNN